MRFQNKGKRRATRRRGCYESIEKAANSLIKYSSTVVQYILQPVVVNVVTNGSVTL